MVKEFSQKPFIVATGGLAGLIAKESETIEEVNPFLTLEGLRIIYRKNVIPFGEKNETVNFFLIMAGICVEKANLLGEV